MSLTSFAHRIFVSIALKTIIGPDVFRYLYLLVHWEHIFYLVIAIYTYIFVFISSLTFQFSCYFFFFFVYLMCHLIVMYSLHILFYYIIRNNLVFTMNKIRVKKYLLPKRYIIYFIELEKNIIQLIINRHLN